MHQCSALKLESDPGAHLEAACIVKRFARAGKAATHSGAHWLVEGNNICDDALVALSEHTFATHGALIGQVRGSAELGLILTPPTKGTGDLQALEHDDSFLTASEIATLKMDAVWVILSACDTAVPQSENALSLSGIARAFFYAGARALLVSHWEVGSDAAVKLTTCTFGELKAHQHVGRAEAFRVSMKELIQRGSIVQAHPSQWAPFVMVGEGRLCRRYVNHAKRSAMTPCPCGIELR